MKSILILLLLLTSCSQPDAHYFEYTERGWIRNIRKIDFFEQGQGFYILLEREEPNGDVTRLQVTSFPQVWIGMHVELRLRKISDYTVEIRSSKLIKEKY